VSSGKRKAEDSADGCRALERDDRERAAANSNPHMRAVLERSADAWSSRARLLDHLERDFTGRAAANVAKRGRRSPEAEDHG
jgi:hypothetical protein